MCPSIFFYVFVCVRARVSLSLCVCVCKFFRLFVECNYIVLPSIIERDEALGTLSTLISLDRLMDSTSGTNKEENACYEPQLKNKTIYFHMMI